MISRFFKLDRNTQFLLIEAFAFLFIARIVVILIPFRIIAKWIGTLNVESERQNNEKYNQILSSVDHVVRIASRYVFWETKCLTQAICGHFILRRRNIEHTLYMGVKFDEFKQLKAHAWMRVGMKIITGAKGHKGYNVTGLVSYFPVV